MANSDSRILDESVDSVSAAIRARLDGWADYDNSVISGFNQRAAEVAAGPELGG